MRTIRITQAAVEALAAWADEKGRRLIRDGVPVAGGLVEISVDDDLVGLLALIDPDPSLAIHMAVGGQVGRA